MDRARTSLMPPSLQRKLDTVVIPAPPPLPLPGMRVVRRVYYVWDDSPRWEAWARDGAGRMWVAVLRRTGWTAWRLNGAMPA